MGKTTNTLSILVHAMKNSHNLIAFVSDKQKHTTDSMDSEKVMPIKLM